MWALYFQLYFLRLYKCEVTHLSCVKGAYRDGTYFPAVFVLVSHLSAGLYGSHHRQRTWVVAPDFCFILIHPRPDIGTVGEVYVGVKWVYGTTCWRCVIMSSVGKWGLDGGFKSDGGNCKQNPPLAAWTHVVFAYFTISLLLSLLFLPSLPQTSFLYHIIASLWLRVYV